MPHVMIVDDNPALREALGDLLRFEGYDVHTAVHGRDALDQLCAGVQPRMIILDLTMPVMDGEGFLAAIRDTPFQSIPVVVLTGMSLTNGATELRERYGREVLDKTGCMEALMRLVAGYCSAGIPADGATVRLQLAA